MEIIILSKNKCNFPTRYFGNKTRNDTVTDSLFIDENHILVADRQDATIYLIKIDLKNKDYKIIDEHICFKTNKYYNHELIFLYNNII